MKYAARINSFLPTDSRNVLEAIEQIGKVGVVTHVDLNYPEHFEDVCAEQVLATLQKNGLKLNALNMRFRKEYIHGVYANPSAQVRQQAIELTREAGRICKQLGGSLVIIWLSYDGYDYAMQMDYPTAWNNLVDAFKAICQDEQMYYAIEYKPYEERGFALLDSYGTTMNLIQEVGAENLGVVIDYCHMLMKKENPAFAAALLMEKKRLYGVHMNDGEGHSDNGFMMGMCTLWKTLELLYYLKKYDFSRVVYFDTFPLREAPADELKANVELFEKMWNKLDEEVMNEIERIAQSQNSIALHKLYQRLITGGA